MCPSRPNDLEAELLRVKVVKPQRPTQAPVQRTASSHQPAAPQPGTTAVPTPGAGIPYQPPQHTVPTPAQPPPAANANTWPAQAPAAVSAAAIAPVASPAPPPSAAAAGAGAQATLQVPAAPQHSPQAPAASKETIDAGFKVFAAASLAGLDGQQKRMLQRLQNNQVCSSLPCRADGCGTACIRPCR